jgi:hypothetical protein
MVSRVGLVEKVSIHENVNEIKLNNIHLLTRPF